VDAGAVGFRLAPRINAAGRLGHPRAALELLLTDDRDQAQLLASELERLNRDRQQVEERIRREAIKQIEAWPEPLKRRRGYVVAGADWHEGVIGIVASRLVERYHRPVVLIAGTDEAWKGSGRSIPSFDLHGALGACAEHLERFGGHRAAAGLSILPGNLEAFAAAFAEQAEGALAEEDLRATTELDAILPPGTPLTLDLCTELERLAPFGLGNAGVTLLAAGVEIAEPAQLSEGKHLRFRVRENGRDAGSAIAFGLGGQLDRFRPELRYDVAFRPQENRWNGTVSPQLVVKRVFDADGRCEELRAWLVEQFKLGEAERDADAAAVFADLELAEGGRRHLLESPTFRALLAREPALAEAA
jgi:single-stranded-DNA-specific exonuclease